MCIQFPETHEYLKQWAVWKIVNNSVSDIGFPRCSSHLNSMSSIESFNDSENIELENINNIVSLLKIRYSDIHLVLLSKYFHRDSDRFGHEFINIPLGQYQMSVKMALMWVDDKRKNLELNSDNC